MKLVKSESSPWDRMTPLEAALAALDDGWAVFPLQGKEPACAGGVKAATREAEQVRRLFNQAPNATGVGGACEDLLVVDIDPRSGGKALEGLPASRVHYSGRGDGGHHLIFKLPAGTPRLKSSSGVLAPGVDTKSGAHSYVVLPGSKHPATGRAYRSNGVAITYAPAELIEKVQTSSRRSAGERSSLPALLNNPPDVGSRNDWLTKVAGHYAIQFRDDEDTYYASVSAANRVLARPLDSDEVMKTAESIWETEQASSRDPELESMLNESNGWLVSGGDCIRTLAYQGPAKQKRLEPYDLCTFDLRVVGKLWDPELSHWVYECDLITRRNPGHVETILVRSTDLGNPRSARQFLSQWSLSVGSGARLAHEDYDWCSRLLMYLDSQEAPVRTITPNYGWSSVEHGYVIGNDVIDAQGLRRCQSVVADPELTWVGDTYGMAGDAQQARRILTDVMHYQEPETASLFGAWWAATLAKQWIQPRVSLFPIMAIEAASGSGKTTGMFSLMAELSGSSSGEGHYTPAVLRNRLSSNRNGITWVDDLDEPTTVHELIRVLTAGGSLSKMDANNNPRQYHLVGSLLLSGESLGMESQKALRERSVLLTPPPPQQRMSHRDPTNSQWMDVVATKDELTEIGGGNNLAGHFLQRVAGLAPKIAEWFQQERKDHARAGRLQDRDLVLLVGARVLQELMLDPHLPGADGKLKTVYQWVYDWVHRDDRKTIDQLLESSDGGDVLEQDNTLTAKLLPMYLAATHGNSFQVNRAARMRYTQEGDYEVAVNPSRIASWWFEKNHGRVNARTESRSSLVAQLKQLRVAYPDNVRSSQRRRLDGGRDTGQVRCWVITGMLAETITKRVDYF